MVGSSNTTSTVQHTAFASASLGVGAIPSGSTSPYVSVGGGGGAHDVPPPHFLPTNLILNTILHNIEQLILQLTNIASASS